MGAKYSKESTVETDPRTGDEWYIWHAFGENQNLQRIENLHLSEKIVSDKKLRDKYVAAFSFYKNKSEKLTKESHEKSLKICALVASNADLKDEILFYERAGQPNLVFATTHSDSLQLTPTHSDSPRLYHDSSRI